MSMNNFNLGRILAKLVNPQLFTQRGAIIQQNTQQQAATQQFTQNLNQPQQNQMPATQQYLPNAQQAQQPTPQQYTQNYQQAQQPTPQQYTQNYQQPQQSTPQQYTQNYQQPQQSTPQQYTQNYQQPQQPAAQAYTQNIQIPQQPAAQAYTQNYQQPQPIVDKSVFYSSNNTELQMNTLKSMDRAVYAREVLQLPKNLNEFVYMVQKGINQAQFNQMFAQHVAAQKNAMSQTQAQILAQLQTLNSPNQLQAMLNAQMATQMQTTIKNLPLSSSGMLDLSQISQMLQVNGKEAIPKLIAAMTQASKQGINDLGQIKDMAKLVNASVAAASQNDACQTMKVLLLLYLPWLPLEEGVGFDLDIEQKEDSEESDSILTITITTVNYGVVVATLILETSNSVHVMIECSKNFPQEELMLRIDGEQKNYSMNSVVTFSDKETKPEGRNAKAKINMSQTTEINPYMLLMAHTIIRHTIEIDNNTTIGITSHTDNS